MIPPVSRTRWNEGTDSRHNRIERARAPPFLPLFLLVEQRGGDARRSRLWNATSPDPSCTVRIAPTCPACITEVSRRGARKRRGPRYDAEEDEGRMGKRRVNGKEEIILSHHWTVSCGPSRSPSQSIREQKNRNFARTSIIY